MARVGLGFVAIAGVPVLLLLDALAAGFRGWWPHELHAVAVLSVAVAFIIIALFLLSWPRGRQLLEQFWAHLVMIVVPTLFACILLEIAMSFVLPDVQRVHRNSANLSRLWQPNPEWLPGIEGSTRYTTNAKGIRGTELPHREEAYRILCVGGSTTENIYLDDEETWPRLLMNLLNEGSRARKYWVGDIGKRGYASNQEVKFLYRSHLPDEMDSLVFLIGVNDLFLALRGDPLVRDPEAPPIWSRSSLYNTLLVAYRSLFRDDVMVETPTGSAYQVRRELRRKGTFIEELPDLTRALEEYRRNVRTLIERSRARRVRPIFLTQPVLWDRSLSKRATDLLWFLRDKHSGLYHTVENLREGMDRFNAALLEVCSEEEAECVDLSSMHGREEFFFDDCHYSEAGAAQLARLVADYLLRHPPGTVASQGGRR